MTWRTAYTLATQAGLAGTVAYLTLDLLLTYTRETACDRDLHRMLAWYSWVDIDLDIHDTRYPFDRGTVWAPYDPSPTPR